MTLIILPSSELDPPLLLSGYRFQYNMGSSLQPTQINTFAKHWTDFQVTLTLRK